MSSTNTIRIPISWSDVDVFTFGRSSLYGYDSVNHCLVVHSFAQQINSNNISNDRLHLSSSPTWPIRRLILNDDETILALLADKIAYLAYLPSSNTSYSKNSPSNGSRLCSIVRVPPQISSIHCSLIDFLWLTSKHFIIVYSIPSSSECYLYTIRSLKSNAIEYLRTFSVGCSSKNKLGTPNKKISLHQPSDIIKLDRTKRIENQTELILLFAMKTDGDLFLLEIDSNELLLNNQILEEFYGPICILPSTFDNYGSDHGQSTFICLTNSTIPLIIFTRNQNQLHQCLLLSPSAHQYYLYTIDLISFSTNSIEQFFTTILQDRFHTNRYFLFDSLANIYSIEISWIEQIQQGLKQIQSTHIQHLIHGNDFHNQIQYLSVIQTDQSYLAAINKSSINQQKELILLRLSTMRNDLCRLKSDFLDYLYSLLSRQQSIPYLTLSSSSSSNIDFEKALFLFIQILTKEYIEKQEHVRKEIENKQDYLVDFQQTQIKEKKQLIERFQRIQQQFQILSAKYQQECLRRRRLSTHVDDLLSIIEQNTPVLSDAEIRMQQQLEAYQIQINCLKEKIQLLQRFLLINHNQDQRQENLSMENIQNYVHNHRNQIEQMKKRLETIQNNQ